MTATASSNSARPAWMIFLIAQAVLVPAAVAVPLVRSGSLSDAPRLPELRNEPLAVTPRYDDPQVVTDGQLAMVLEKLRPQLAHQQPKVNHVDHALRFWGVDARFDDPACLSGEAMRQLLLDHGTFAAAWGESTHPLLERVAGGVAVRTQLGFATASHVDHTLATLAEIGTPLDQSIVTASGPATVADVLRGALSDFSLNQQEYEWTTLALALYSPEATPWRSKERQAVTFDRLADRIMRQPYAQGVCYGNHRLFTLAVLLHVDDEHEIFSSTARTRVVEHLIEATGRLIATQSSEGYWDENWSGAGNVTGDVQKMKEQGRRLLATGHALEWWAVAPSDLHPPRDVIVRAGQWLVGEVGPDGTGRDRRTLHRTDSCRPGALVVARFPAGDFVSATGVR